MNSTKVWWFSPQENAEHRLFNGAFRKSEKQEAVVLKVASDLGGLFNLLRLPKYMEVELIGIGTLGVLSNDTFAKRRYAEKLVEALEYLEEVAQ